MLITDKYGNTFNVEMVLKYEQEPGELRLLGNALADKIKELEPKVTELETQVKSSDNLIVELMDTLQNELPQNDDPLRAVLEHLDRRLAHCICVSQDENFKFEEKTVKFIEDAVKEKLESSKTDDVPKFKYVVEKATIHETPTGDFYEYEPVFEADTPLKAYSKCTELQTNNEDGDVFYQTCVELVEYE